MPYLVDGNNLAHALGLATAGLADREACARTVAAFCRSHGAQATVVFDGRGPETTKGPTRRHPVSVRYSGSRSADDVILGLLGSSKTPRDFTVVTSDKPLGDKARHRGARVERAHEFSRRLERKPAKTRPPGEERAPTETAAEIEAWLAVFDPARR